MTSTPQTMLQWAQKYLDFPNAKFTHQTQRVAGPFNIRLDE